MYHICKRVNYSSSFDVLNNYQPYSQRLGLKLLDDCSMLDTVYENSRYNDQITLNQKKQYHSDILWNISAFLTNQNFNSVFTDM